MGIAEWLTDLEPWAQAALIAGGLSLAAGGAAIFFIERAFRKERYRGARRMGKPRGPSTLPPAEPEPGTSWERTPSGGWRMVPHHGKPKHHRAEGEADEQTRFLHPGYDTPTGRARVAEPEEGQ